MDAAKRDQLLYAVSVIESLECSAANANDLECLKKTVDQYGWDSIKNFIVNYLDNPSPQYQILRNLGSLGQSLPPQFIQQQLYLINEMEKLGNWEILEVLIELTERYFYPWQIPELRSFPDQLINPDTITTIQTYLSQAEYSLDPSSFENLTDPFETLEIVNKLVQYFQNNQLYAASKDFIELIDSTTSVDRIKDYHQKSVFQDPEVQVQKLEVYAQNIFDFWEIMKCPEVWDRFLAFERVVNDKGFTLGIYEKIFQPVLIGHIAGKPYYHKQSDCNQISLGSTLRNSACYQGILTLMDHIMPCDLAEFPPLFGTGNRWLEEPEQLQNAIKIIRTLQQKRQEQDQIYAYLSKRFNHPTLWEDTRKSVYQLAHPEKVTFDAFLPFVENAVATDHLCEYLQQKDHGLGYFVETQLNENPDYRTLTKVIEEKERDPLWQFSENKKFDTKSISDLYYGFCSEKIYQKYKEKNQLETYIFTKKRKKKW